MKLTNRKTHNVHQGSPEWHLLRANHHTASEAPSALGVGRYTSRSSLVKQKATGIPEEHDAAALARFARGHAAEANARYIAESILGEELSPVTMTAEAEGLALLASLDGQTFDGSVIWETKLWNEELAEHVRSGSLPGHYTVQMDQQLAVSGAARCLFTCSDGTPERTVHCWYETSSEKLDRLIVGWKMFSAEVKTYTPPDASAAPEGRAPNSLPALRLEVSGAVTSSNLEEWRGFAMATIAGINRTLRTDADFANAEKTVKWCAEAEARLKAAKEAAIAQTESIERAFRVIDDVSTELRRARLDLDKLVKAEKDARKSSKVMDARTAFHEHVQRLQSDCKGVALSVQMPDFAGAIKGLSSLNSIDERLTATLIEWKSLANTQAGRVVNNLRALDSLPQYAFLFADRQDLAHKDSEALELLIHKRVTDHQAAEVVRLEAERERIRQEEAAKLQREAREAEARAERERQEAMRQELLRVEREAQEGIAEARALGALPATLLDDLSSLAKDVKDDAVAGIDAAQVIGSAQRAAATPAVVPLHAPATAEHTGTPTLKLGQIAERLGFTLTADFLKGLGFEPAATDRASKLYFEADFPLILAALVRHIEAVRSKAAA